jgi:hypothetical protein
MVERKADNSEPSMVVTRVDEKGGNLVGRSVVVSVEPLVVM